MIRLLLVVLAAGFAWGCGAAPPGAGSGGPDPGALTVRFLDVGQGDAVLLVSPGGRAVLYDGGTPTGRARDYLEGFGIEALELVVASHPHQDHIGGLAEVIEHYRPPYVLDNGLPHTTRTYERYLEAVRSAGSALLDPEARTLTIDGVELEVLPPPGNPSLGMNDNSVGMVVTFGDFRMTLGGDAEAAQWEWWLADGHLPAGPVQVHKASHHGSRNGDTAAAIARLRPERVVIGVGASNSYGHPHPEALELYRGATVHRTDLDGTVTVRVGADGHYEVWTERER